MSDPSDARRLLKSGDLAAAELAYERVLAETPDHTEALNVVPLGSLRTGRTARALDLLERAAVAAPTDAPTQHHLGRVYQAVGDLRRAAAAHAKAVHLEPGFFLARLSWAEVLEQLGKAEDAVIQYKRSLDEAQRAGRWLGPETTPEPLRPLVLHAVSAVRQGRRATFEKLIGPLRERYGGSSMTRVERCLRVYLNDEAPVYPDPRQRPTFLFFPDLPTSAYIHSARFDWIEALEAATDSVRAEMEGIMSSASARERVFGSDALEAEHLRGIGAVPSWNAYYFFRHGIRRDDNWRSCPLTARTLEALPLSAIREHGPEVLFSVFTPGTHLMPHRGVTNTRVVGHLPLVIPEDCALKVGGEIHEWHEGRVVVFDDTYEHEAWNRSRSTRVVLIFDVWNPYLSDAERAAITDVVGAIGDFRNLVEQA